MYFNQNSTCSDCMYSACRSEEGISRFNIFNIKQISKITINK